MNKSFRPIASALIIACLTISAYSKLMGGNMSYTITNEVLQKPEEQLLGGNMSHTITNEVKQKPEEQLLGGDMSHTITNEVKQKSEELLAETKENSTEHSTNFFAISKEKGTPKLVYYTTQVVNGTNYHMIYKLQGTYTCVDMFKAMEYTGKKAKMTGFSEYGSKANACKKCYEIPCKKCDENIPCKKCDENTGLMIDCINTNDRDI